MVVGLFGICNSSYRGIKFFLQCLFDYPIGLGSVFNIIDVAADKAAALNGAYVAKRHHAVFEKCFQLNTNSPRWGIFKQKA